MNRMKGDIKEMTGMIIRRNDSEHGRRPEALKRFYVSVRLSMVFLLTFIFSIGISAQAWVARHDLTSSAYQSEFTKWKSKGYRLISVSGYAPNNQIRYAAIWEKKRGPLWVGRHNLTSAQYQAEFSKWMKQGYRLAHVSGFGYRGQARFAAVWEKKKGPAAVGRHNLNSNAYQAEFNKWKNKGYRLTCLSGYTVKGQPRFAAFWEKKSGPAWTGKHNLTSSQYQAEFSKLMRQGYRLLKVSGYSYKGSARYAGIWVKKAGQAGQGVTT